MTIFVVLLNCHPDSFSSPVLQGAVLSDVEKGGGIIQYRSLALEIVMMIVPQGIQIDNYNWMMTCYVLVVMMEEFGKTEMALKVVLQTIAMKVN